jgi:hypothetical protein
VLIGAHAAATLGAAGLLPARVRERIDLRLLVVCGLLPDLIDKALYLLPLDRLTGRRLGRGASVGHSLLAVMLVGVALRPRMSVTWAYAGAVLGHLVLDGIWRRPATLLWPLLGLGLEGGRTAGVPGTGPATRRRARDLGIIYGQVLLGNAEQGLAELVGLATVLSLAHQWRLHRPKVAWSALRTGRLSGGMDRCGCS